MPNKKLVLTFPKRLVHEPVMYHLVKDFDLQINIIRASISPDEAGHLVIEFDGTSEQLARGQAYLEEIGVQVEPLGREVRWREERCVHCTACVTVCPTQALTVERPSMKVSFRADKCIGCELCIPVCSFDAMEIDF